MPDASAKIAEAFVEVRYSFDRLGRDLRSATSTVDRQLGGIETTARRRFSGLAQAIAAPFRSLSNTLSGVQGQVAALGSALAVGLAVRSVVRTNVEFERLKGALQTVTGSAEAGQAAFAGLVKFAARTPNSVQDVVGAFIKLKTLGIEPTEERLLSFANTAAATGKSLNQFVEAVADASVGEFERLKEFGIRAKTQGDEVTFIFNEVATTVGKNAAEITRYLDEIGDTKFGDAVAQQMERLPGLVSNLGDVFGQLSLAIGTGGLNGGMVDLLKVMIDVGAETDGLATQLGGVLGSALSEIAGAAKSAQDAFAQLSPATKDLATKFTVFGTAIAAALPLLALFAVSIGALLNPLGLVVGALAALTAAAITFGDSVVKVGGANVSVGNTISAVWTTVTAVFEGAIRNAAILLSLLKSLATLDFAGAGRSITEFGDKFLEDAKRIGEAWSSILVPSDTVRAELEGWRRVFESAGDDLVSNAEAQAQAAKDALANALGDQDAVGDSPLGDLGLDDAAAEVRTVGDAIRDVRFDTLLAGLKETEAEALRAAEAVGLVKYDPSQETNQEQFAVNFEDLESFGELRRAFEELEVARNKAADAAARNTLLNERAIAIQEDLTSSSERYAIELQRIDELYQKKKLTADEAAQAIARLNAEYDGVPTAQSRLEALNQTMRTLAVETETAAGQMNDMLIGFTQGVADYAVDAGNGFENARRLGERAMQGLEDALVQFATTGKLSVKDMVESILADLARLAIRQSLASGLSGILGVAGTALGAYFGGPAGAGAAGGGTFGGSASTTTSGSFTLPKFATGGSFAVGGGGGVDSQLVAFRATPGEIVNVYKGSDEYRRSRAGGGGASVSQNVTIDARGADAGVELRIRSAMRDAVEQAKTAVRDEALRSGSYGRAFG